jgi:hypothetical protein
VALLVSTNDIYGDAMQKLKKDDKVFLKLPKENAGKKRILHEAIVLQIEGETCVVQLTAPCPGIEPATDAFLHFELRRKFMQQSVHVLRKDSEDPPVIAVELRGDPVSAESRQAFRASTFASDIHATIGSEANCKVVDVSASGFAFYARGKYEIGQQLRALLSYEGKDHSGHVTVMSSRPIDAKQVRYGVHVVATNNPKDTLAKSLGSINMSVQAEQLRRLSGNE